MARQHRQIVKKQMNSLVFFCKCFTHENLSNIPIVQDLNFDRPLETIDVSINQVETLLHKLNTTKFISVTEIKIIKDIMLPFNSHISKISISELCFALNCLI